MYLQLAELSEDLTQLPVNSLLAAAFITYLSFAPEDVRQSLMAEWQNLFGMKNFSFTTFLGSEKDQLQWLSEGLPSDQLSIQNALIILQVMVFIINMPQLNMPGTVAWGLPRNNFLCNWFWVVSLGRQLNQAIWSSVLILFLKAERKSKNMVNSLQSILTFFPTTKFFIRMTTAFIHITPSWSNNRVLLVRGQV